MLDLIVSQYFYTKGVGFINNGWTDFIYTYGLVPGWLLFGFGLVALLFFKNYRREGLYLVLVLGLGSGLICHAGFKDNWGRPRPKQTVEFGGYAPYKNFWQMNRTEDRLLHRSFCCGHCTMGFYFFALYFLGKKRWGLFLALFLGGLLSLTRIAQGGHYLSDTVVAAIVMWSTSYCLAKIMLPRGV